MDWYTDTFERFIHDALLVYDFKRTATAAVRLCIDAREVVPTDQFPNSRCLMRLYATGAGGATDIAHWSAPTWDSRVWLFEDWGDGASHAAERCSLLVRVQDHPRTLPGAQGPRKYEPPPFKGVEVDRARFGAVVAKHSPWWIVRGPTAPSQNVRAVSDAMTLLKGFTTADAQRAIETVVLARDAEARLRKL